MHHADIAEILDELDFNEATYIFKVLDSENSRNSSRIRRFAGKYIKQAFKEIAEELDVETNDAADIIAELSQDLKAEVISELQDGTC
jgi:magnesium transporter